MNDEFVDYKILVGSLDLLNIISALQPILPVNDMIYVHLQFYWANNAVKCVHLQFPQYLRFGKASEVPFFGRPLSALE